MSRQPIECYGCGTWCGWCYPATRWQPSESEGPGIQFEDEEGHWFCSRDCRDESVAEREED